jgi:hypothetical protein
MFLNFGICNRKRKNIGKGKNIRTIFETIFYVFFASEENNF